MLSAFLPSGHRAPALALGRTTGTPEVRPLGSSRTRSSSPQAPCARSGEGPTVLLRLPARKGAGHFCLPLPVAWELGLYLHPTSVGVRRTVSEGPRSARMSSRDILRLAPV